MGATRDRLARPQGRAIREADNEADELAMALAKQVVAALHKVLPEGGGPYPLHEPVLAGNELLYLKECIDTNWVSSAGSYVERFEDDLAALTGAQGVTATVNGTAALHCCLVLAGIAAGDEVLTPTLTFVATANSVAYCGATPHFVDCETQSLGVDANKLAEYLERIADPDGEVCRNRATGRPIRALIVTHVFGHPADLDALGRLCARYRLTLIEDAAEALGSRYKGVHVGTASALAALSFNGNKIVTTGGGGAVLAKDPDMARRAGHLTTTARVPDPFEYLHDEVGYNYRLPNINAAMGCAQLEQLPGFLAAKRRLAEAYARAFSRVKGVYFLREPAHASSNYWLNAIVLEPKRTEQRDDVLRALHSAGFLCRPAWRPMHRLPMYADCPKMPLDTAEDLQRRIINLPSGARLAAACQAQPDMTAMESVAHGPN